MNGPDDRADLIARITRLVTDVRAHWQSERSNIDAADDVDALMSELEAEVGKLVQFADALDERRHELERDHARWRKLFDVALDAYIVTDESGMIIAANRKATELLNGPTPTMPRHPLVLHFAPESRSDFQRMLRSEHAAVERATITMRDVDAETFQGELRCVRIDGSRILWQIRDVTTEARARVALEGSLAREHAVVEQMEELEAMRRAFLLAVSHDLRTPLAAIRALAATLNEPSLGSEARALALARIRDVADETIMLLRDLLDYERLADGTMPLLRRRVDAADVVRNALVTVPHDGHEIHVDATSTAADLDAGPVGRIVANLVRNAVQHTPAGTTVWVRCRRAADGVLLVVEDDGPGVPRARHEAIFELFERERRSTGPGGLGIGLALVRRFAELHGGYARVEPRPGGGASFQVLIPG